MILATIERHKQNSETFNKAFNSSFSREDDHVPESPVSLAQSVSALIRQLVVSSYAMNHDRLVGTPNESVIVWSLSARNSSPSMDVVVSHTHIKRLFLFIPDSCSRSVCESLSNPETLSWPNRESPSQSVYKTHMDLLWPTLGMAGAGRQPNVMWQRASITRSRLTPSGRDVRLQAEAAGAQCAVYYSSGSLVQHIHRFRWWKTAGKGKKNTTYVEK